MLTYQTEEFYIGSVNYSIKENLEKLLQSANVNYHYLTHEHFRPFIKVSSQIDFNELGLDLLSIIYFVEDTDYLFINNGTALVYLKYSQQLDGVIISNNIFYDTEQLMHKTHLDCQYQDHYDFACNTSDAIAAGISFSFKKTLVHLMEQHQMQKLYINGIDPIYLQQLDKYQIQYLGNTTLLGYIKLLKHLNILTH